MLGAMALYACQPLGVPAGSRTPYKGGVFTDLPPDYQTAEVSADMTFEAIESTISPVAPPTGSPPTWTPLPFETGIFADTYGPLLRFFAASNHWQGVVNGQRTVVWAGARTGETFATPTTDEGMVILQTLSADFTNSSWETYSAPGNVGLLTVTAETNLRLTLNAANESTLYFDLVTRQFVSSLSEPISVATITPLPPRSPTPTWFPRTPTPFPAYPGPVVSATVSVATDVAPIP
jgi:hypothetical protein